MDDEDGAEASEKRRDMKQAVKDLREMYGRELGSDDTDDGGE